MLFIVLLLKRNTVESKSSFKYIGFLLGLNFTNNISHPTAQLWTYFKRIIKTQVPSNNKNCVKKQHLFSKGNNEGNIDALLFFQYLKPHDETFYQLEISCHCLFIILKFLCYPREIPSGVLYYYSSLNLLPLSFYYIKISLLST